MTYKSQALRSFAMVSASGSPQALSSLMLTASIFRQRARDEGRARFIAHTGRGRDVRCQNASCPAGRGCFDQRERLGAVPQDWAQDGRANQLSLAYTMSSASGRRGAQPCAGHRRHRELTLARARLQSGLRVRPFGGSPERYRKGREQRARRGQGRPALPGFEREFGGQIPRTPQSIAQRAGPASSRDCRARDRGARNRGAIAETALATTSALIIGA